MKNITLDTVNTLNSLIKGFQICFLPVRLKLLNDILVERRKIKVNKESVSKKILESQKIRFLFFNFKGSSKQSTHMRYDQI